MKIHKGDTVMIMAGKERGKTAKVIRAFPGESRVLVEGINMKKRHQRARKSNEKGQILEKAHPLHVSTVMLVDPKRGKPTRVGYAVYEKKKDRISRKSGLVI